MKMRFVLILGAGCLAGTAVWGLDYGDHGAVCAAVEENRTHAWLDGEKERFRVTCPCEVAAMEKLLEPEKFEWAMAWKVDAKAFAKNLPEGINITEFMSEVIPVGLTATQSCK